MLTRKDDVLCIFAFRLFAFQLTLYARQSRCSHFVVILQHIFFRDLLVWICIYVIFLFGFSLAMYVLVREQFVNNSAGIILGE